MGKHHDWDRWERLTVLDADRPNLTVPNSLAHFAREIGTAVFSFPDSAYVRLPAARFGERKNPCFWVGRRNCGVQANICSTTFPQSATCPGEAVSAAQSQESNYSTAQKGELALLRVLQRALQKGWITCKPTRDCRYDLVLDDGERLHRVQVKYAGRRASNCVGAVSLDFTKGGSRDRTYLDHEIDAVIAYVAPADRLVWLRREHFHGRRTIQLRYVPTRSGQKNGCLMVDELAW